MQKGAGKKNKPGWIILENQYTADVFSRSRLVNYIRHSGGLYITIHCNTGKRRRMKEATLKGYTTV